MAESSSPQNGADPDPPATPGLSDRATQLVEELVGELVKLGRTQTERLLSEIADRVKRGGGSDRSFPIADYEEMTVAQVTPRLAELTPAQLRQVREFERRHANRKSVLAAIEKALS